MNSLLKKEVDVAGVKYYSEDWIVLEHKYYDDESNTKIVKYGVINSTGEWIIKYGKYDIIEGISNGRARVGVFDKERNDPDVPYKYGIVDKNGKVIVKTGKYDYMESFRT